MLTREEAIHRLRRDPRYAELIHDSYLGEDTVESARRFEASAEFAEVCQLVGDRAREGKILDLGSGIGIAAYGFARRGAKCVYALEPDPSDEIGRGALLRLCGPLPIVPVDACGERIPLPDAQLDLVYARQVLHHAQDLPQVLRECARVLKRGGRFLASREHVVDDERQLKTFLQRHPVHRLAGGENAFPLRMYLEAIRAAGLRPDRVFGQWDTLINAFPTARSADELRHLSRIVLQRRFGRRGIVLSRLPGVNALVRAWLNRPFPGRLYSFLATKP